MLKWGLAATLVIATLAGQTSPERQEPSDAVDAYVARQMSRYRIPGMAVAVVVDGENVKLQGYGKSSVSLDVPVHENTVFQLFSVSKMWAAIVAMKLADKGVIELDAPVAETVDGLPDEWRAITLRDLLSHTSGIAEWRSHPNAAQLSDAQKKALTAEQTVRMAAELPVHAPPGARWAYHRTGYNFVTWVLETAAGKRYAELVKNEVFDPLEMRATRFGDMLHIVPGRAAVNYYWDQGVLKHWLYEFGEAGYSASALNSSISDIAKFLVAVQGDRLLSAERWDQILSPTRLSDGSTYRYGLGWTVGEHAGRKVVGHEGGGATWIAHFPEERVSVAVLTNLNALRADHIQYDIADLYLK